MSPTINVDFYSSLEERMNVLSHALGLCLSIAALVLLVVRASLYGNVWHIVSFSIFGSSLVLLYAASTLYHSAKKLVLRRRLRVVDHAMIYILIAGTYTPFTLVTLNGVTGWILFGLTWGIALTGIILKLFFTGRFDVLSTFMYLLMGWLIIFAIKPLIANLATAGLFWLVMGGLAYTLGAILYSIKKIKFNHANLSIYLF